MSLGLRVPDGVRVMPLAGSVHLMLTDNAGVAVRLELGSGDALDLAAALTRAAAHPEVRRGC